MSKFSLFSFRYIAHDEVILTVKNAISINVDLL
jgi:hypothetical protein